MHQFYQTPAVASVWIDARERVVYQEWDQFWWKHFPAVIASVTKHSSLLLGRCRRIASASGLAGEEISHLISLEGCIITGDGLHCNRQMARRLREAD